MVIIFSLDLLTLWVSITNGILDRFENREYIGIKFFAYSQEYAQVFNLIINLITQHPNQLPMCIVSTTGITKFDNKINKLKCKTFSCFNIILTFLFESSSKVPVSPFGLSTRQLCQLVMHSLYLLCSSPTIDIDKDIQMNSYKHQLVVHMLDLLTKAAGERDYYSIFAETKKKMLVEVILVLLTSTESEIMDLQEQPEEFVALSLDTCDKQESDVLKTAAAQFLEILCDHVDGSLTYITVFCLHALDYAIKGAKPETAKDYIALVEFQNSVFIAKTRDEIIVETSVLVLTVLSYLIPKREDLLKVLDETMCSHLESLYATPSIIIRARMALFLGYYADTLFKMKENLFFSSLKFLIMMLQSTGKEKVLALQVLYFLLILIEC